MPQNLTIAQKKVRVYWYKEMLENYDRGASTNVYKIFTSDELWILACESETMQQSTVSSTVSSKSNHIQRMFFVKKSLRSKWWPVSSAKLVM